MTALKWDQDSQRLYETGTSHGALYVQEDDGTYGDGVAWNGLIGVSESPSGAEETALYANDSKYASMRSAEEQEGSISAYTYPDEWMACDGSVSVMPGFNIGQQTRRAFALTWQTIIGNDVQLDGYGKKIHIIYSATASPSEKEYSTVNDSPEAIEFSWDYKCTPIDMGIPELELKKSATITIDSTKISKTAWKAITDKLYGTADDAPTLLMPKDIYEILDEDEGEPVVQQSKVQTQPAKANAQVNGSSSTNTDAK